MNLSGEDIVSVVMPSFKDSDMVSDALVALNGQELPHECRIEIIVVDDGNPEEHRLRLQALDPRVRLVVMKENGGRSAARQRGAEVAQGRYLYFMDSDCRPFSADCIARHLSVIAGGAVASVGGVMGGDGGFWDWYQRLVSRKRWREHELGRKGIGSTANLMVRAASFRESGGFDVGFRCYGFEDTDLILRLEELGRVGWASDASVRHLDETKLMHVVSKMHDSARFSAPLMRKKHAAFYSESAYGLIDCRLHPVLRPIAVLIAPLPHRLACVIDALIESGLLPWVLAGLAVKCVSAMSYLVGTAKSG